jgi:hypothetical protein
MEGFGLSRRGLTAIFAVLAVLVAASGCGSSSGDDSTANAALANVPLKETFVKQGDAICAKGRKEVQTKFAAFLKKEGIKGIGPGGGESPAEIKAHEIELVETIGIPALDKQLKELKALGAPKGEEEKVEEYFEAAEEALEKGEAEPQLLFSKVPQTFAKADKIAQELGFEVCGNH